jgi:hypothetical protein
MPDGLADLFHLRLDARRQAGERAVGAEDHEQVGKPCVDRPGYRTYVGSSRCGEPPIIKADNAPTKIMPASPDGSAKVPDRLAVGDETEKIVPREEARVDISTTLASRSGWFWRLRPPPSKMSVIRSQVSPA